MTDTTYLRELLAEATPPGHWRAAEGDLEGGTLNDYIAKLLANRQADGTSTGRLWLTLDPNDIDPEHGAEVVPAMTGDGPRARANAVLVAAAVNALPELLAEIDRLSRAVEVEKASVHNALCRVIAGETAAGNTDRAAALRSFRAWHRGAGYVTPPADVLDQLQTVTS